MAATALPEQFRHSKSVTLRESSELEEKSSRFELSGARRLVSWLHYYVGKDAAFRYLCIGVVSFLI